MFHPVLTKVGPLPPTQIFESLQPDGVNFFDISDLELFDLLLIIVCNIQGKEMGIKKSKFVTKT